MTPTRLTDRLLAVRAALDAAVKGHASPGDVLHALSLLSGTLCGAAGECDGLPLSAEDGFASWHAKVWRARRDIARGVGRGLRGVISRARRDLRPLLDTASREVAT